MKYFFLCHTQHTNVNFDMTYKVKTWKQEKENKHVNIMALSATLVSQLN